MFEIVAVCDGGGYRYCRTVPIHPKANSKGLYPLHRVLIENKLNRLLEDNEIVHHIDGDKSNDDQDNLIVMLRSEHSSFHRSIENLVCICPKCSSAFEIKPYRFRLRQKKNKSGEVYCSRSCGGKS